MAKLTRLKAKIFGETASTTNTPKEIGQFGSGKLGTYNATGDVATIQDLPAWSNGWIGAVTPNDQFPPLPEMTGVHKVLSYQEAYLLQQGVPEWNADTDYYKNGFCSYNGLIYRSIADDNTGNQPDNESYWELYGAIDDYANQDLTNLTTIGNARLQYAPFSINQGTVVNGKNNTLKSESFIQTYNNAGTYTIEITDAGQYEIEMYGGGGSSGRYKYDSQTRFNSGGSGAGYKGIVNLSVGSYTITVGKGYTYSEQGDGGSTSISYNSTNLIIAGGGTRGRTKTSSASPGAGGTVTINDSSIIVSTTFNKSGNAGGTKHINSYANVYNLNGGLSVYDNTTTGYGAGCGCQSGAKGVDGFFKITKLTGSLNILGCDTCTITTTDGRTQVTSPPSNIDVSTQGSGTYCVFKDYETGSLSLISNFVISDTEPDTPSNNDYWLDTLMLPAQLKYYDTSEWVINNNLVYIGECTITNGVISEVVNLDFNVVKNGKTKGQFTVIADNVSINTTSSYFDVSSVLPKDEYSYLCNFQILGKGSAAGVGIELRGDGMSEMMSMRAYNSSGIVATTGWLIINERRRLYSRCPSGSFSSVQIAMYSYRRIGIM